MGRDKKRIVFLIFEGTSDFNALYIPLSRLIAEVDHSIRVADGHIIDENQIGGDITSKYGVKPENIQGVMAKNIFMPKLNTLGIYPKDIIEVIQFVDMDGAYVSDDLIVFEDKLEKTMYGDKIYTNDVDGIIERNARKRANLDYLTQLSEIKIKSKSIKYSVYYFSTNLEHVISNKMNMENSNKRQNAQNFQQKELNTTKSFQEFFIGVMPASQNITYEESWDYIKKEENSIKRFSNVGVLINRILNEGIGLQ